MTTKERWTVYPLLLLAIGLAMRGNLGVPTQFPGLFADTVTADTVFCKELAIVTDDGRILVHAGQILEGAGGRIEIHDAKGIDALGLGTSADSRDGVIEFFDVEGNPIGRLGSPSSDRPAVP